MADTDWTMPTSVLSGVLWGDRAAIRSRELTPLYIERYVGPHGSPRYTRHRCWELILVLRGSGWLTMTDEELPLSSGTAVLVPPTLRHRERSVRPMEVLWTGLAGSRLDALPGRLHIAEGGQLVALGEMLWAQARQRHAPAGAELDGLATALLARVLHLADSEPSAGGDLVDQMLAYLCDHLADCPRCRVWPDASVCPRATSSAPSSDAPERPRVPACCACAWSAPATCCDRAVCRYRLSPASPASPTRSTSAGPSVADVAARRRPGVERGPALQAGGGKTPVTLEISRYKAIMVRTGSLPARAVTMREIAVRAGVSLPTASGILTSRAHLFRAETCERVQAAAREFGYRPSAMARGMRNGRCNAIGLVTSARTSRGDLPIPLRNAALEAARRRDQHIIVANLDDSALGDPDRVPRLITELACDGLLVNYTHGAPDVRARALADHRVPTVVGLRNVQHHAAHRSARTSAGVRCP